jgi:cytochrome c oxidase subunit 4
MTHAPLSPRTYLLVCAVLVLLTFATLGVSLAPLPGSWHLALGFTIALLKAALVVLFFMHALHSSAVTRIVIAVATFWLLLLFALTLCDYFTRELR